METTNYTDHARSVSFLSDEEVLRAQEAARGMPDAMKAGWGTTKQSEDFSTDGERQRELQMIGNTENSSPSSAHM